MTNNYGFVRVAAAVPRLKVADTDYNVSEICSLIDQAVEENVQIVSFPELCITGYTCGDLFFWQQLQQRSYQALEEICNYTKEKPIVVIVGAPLAWDNNLYNCAFVMTDGDVIGVVPKQNLPNTGEFYEKRWFSPWEELRIMPPSRTNSQDGLKVELWNGEVPFGTDLLFMMRQVCFGIELCEDLWSPLPPSTQLAIQGAEIIFNLSASNCIVGKHAFRREMLMQQSARVLCGYVYTSAGIGESTTDAVFSGSTYIAEKGELLSEGERFQDEPMLLIQEIDVERIRVARQRNTNFTNDRIGHYRKCYVAPVELEENIEPLHREIAPFPFLPTPNTTHPLEPCEDCEDIFSILTTALARRWQHTHAQTLVLGVSGGLDSTLALLIAVKTADKLGYSRKQVIGVTMPGFGTSGRTYQNALNLMEELGISMHEIDIQEAVKQHLQDINHNIDNHDITYENAQARERTQILMDLANKYNGLVVGTGDMSELALGWCTYNADQMSMYGINAGIPKTLVRYLTEYYANFHCGEEIKFLLQDIVNTPVSPELLPTDEEGNITQRTEDKIGPYELNDFFLYHFLQHGFAEEKIAYLASIAFEGVYTEETIEHWLNVFMNRFFTQQYKRSAMPDGPKVVSITLSPRADWRMPSDAAR